MENNLNKQVKQQNSENKEKKRKGLIIGLAIFGAIGLAGSIVGPLCAKSCSSSMSELEKTHAITIDTEDPDTGLYDIQLDKTSAKKGETVNFILTPKTTLNVKKRPVYIKLNDSSYKLTTVEEDKKWTAQIVIELVDDMKVKVVNEDVSETFQVIFKNGDDIYQTQEVPANTCAVEPKEPVKEDYTLEGWYTNKEGTGDPFNFNSKINTQLTLYAKWTGDYADPLLGYEGATTFKAITDSTVAITKNGTPKIGETETKIDYYDSQEGNWKTISNSANISLKKGDFLYLKGDNPNGLSTSDSNYWNIAIYGKCNIGGSVMGLLFNGQEPSTEQPQTSIPNNYCFAHLFKYCYGLNKIHKKYLPATTLTNYCYKYMFYESSKLVNSPTLPAGNKIDGVVQGSLAQYCYEGMFRGCNALITAPELPATTLVGYCYFQMFYQCSALQTAPILPAGKEVEGTVQGSIAPYCYQQMFQGCISLITAPELPATILSNYCYKQMFSGCRSLVIAPELPAKQHFDDNGQVVDGLVNCCYQQMFEECYALQTAPTILPATTLAAECYANMFYKCTSLTIAPELPAGKEVEGTVQGSLAKSCYQGMFFGCTSLTTAPELPATTLNESCYKNMFSGCTELTTVPTKLPAENLSKECYYGMFSGCTRLTTIPDNFLPAVTLAYSCYDSMFQNCSLLQTAPELPAGKEVEGTVQGSLAERCYYNMFNGCTSLTTAPELPAKVLPTISVYASYGCYHGMFSGCTSLQTAPELPATTLNASCYKQMFFGCTSLTTAPELPATTLTHCCYFSMFENCTSLASAPALSATTLANQCYYQMFQGCSSLKISNTAGTGKTLFFTAPSSYTYQGQYMFNNTGGEYTSSPAANGTYYWY